MSELKRIADEVRNIPLEHILRAAGLKERREGTSTKWTSEAHGINVTGAKWFDHKAGRGGGGAIDLVMHLQHLPYREAVLALADFRGVSTVEASPLPSHPVPQPERAPFGSLLVELAFWDETQWPTARNYLVNTRMLPETLVETLHRSGLLYANDHRPNPSLVFLHTDAEGNVRGASLRDTRHQSAFRPTLGDKTAAWFTTGTPLAQAERVVLVESAIDAMSYTALFNPPSGTAVISLSGCRVTEALQDLCVKRGWGVTVALDNDPPGNAEAARLAEIPFLSQQRHLPAGKDWNEDLCQKLKPLFNNPPEKKTSGRIRL